VFDLLLQLDAVLAQDFRDLALLGRQASEHIVGQELRAFAQRGQRRFQLVRNLLQKTVLLLLEVDELAAHPFQPVAEVLEVGRAGNADRRIEFTFAKLADGRIDLPDWTRYNGRKAEDQENHHGNQRQRLPQHDAPRFERGAAHFVDLVIDQARALGDYRLRMVCQFAKPGDLRLQGLGRQLGIGKRVENLPLSRDNGIELGALVGIERQLAELR